MPDQNSKSTYAPTGTEGLDHILGGGLSRGHVFLLEGEPGTGKTTVAIQFLRDGAARGERGLYVTLSETEAELRQSATSHSWTLDPSIEIAELQPPEGLLDEDRKQTLLYSSDLELGETTRAILQAVERSKPDRIVIDSLSEFRLLAQNSLRYRRQILAIKHFFNTLGTTVLLLDDLTADMLDKTVDSVTHGVIRLEELAPNYGAERRRLRVVKYRGQRYLGGYHDFKIATGGVQVFPRLVAADFKVAVARRRHSTGIAELDSLLAGGMYSGSSTLVLGPAGTGKSILSMAFVQAAIARGEKAAMFVFDEEVGLLTDRLLPLGFDIAAMRAEGKLYLEHLDAAELSPGEFSHRVRARVEEDGIGTVVIDSLNGYQAAMPEENSLILHMHELLQYLNRRGASTFLTVAQHGLIGEMKSPVDVTYLADTVILLRYFEAFGRVRRAISIVKQRAGGQEASIREYRIDQSGFSIAEPLTGFQGVLRGVPTFSGAAETLIGGERG